MRLTKLCIYPHPPPPHTSPVFSTRQSDPVVDFEMDLVHDRSRCRLHLRVSQSL